MKHLAIDIGRNAVKVVGEDGYQDIFPSYVGAARHLKLTNSLRPTDIILEYEGKSYFAGDLAKDESYDGSRLMMANKIHEDTKILALAAIGRALAKDDDLFHDHRFIVTTGVPVEFHTPVVKKAMSDLLKGHYEIQVNGTKLKFEIAEVLTSIEGPSSYTVLCKGQGGVKCFIDAGSRTINYGKMVNGRYVDRESGTFDWGCDTIQDHDALARMIITNLSQKWKTFDEETFLLGGGTLFLAERLAPYFPKLVVTDDAQFVNAKAFYEIGEKARCKLESQTG